MKFIKCIPSNTFPELLYINTNKIKRLSVLKSADKFNVYADLNWNGSNYVKLADNFSTLEQAQEFLDAILRELNKG